MRNDWLVWIGGSAAILTVSGTIQFHSCKISVKEWALELGYGRIDHCAGLPQYMR
jgi:hypothetical protein